VGRHRLGTTTPRGQAQAKAAKAARIAAAFREAQQIRRQAQAIRDQVKAAQQHIGAH
jgi:hypothetical protein